MEGHGGSERVWCGRSIWHWISASCRCSSSDGSLFPSSILPGSICFHTLVIYFNLDFVTSLEIAVNCFVTLSLEQLVPRADRTDPVLAYNNLRWHSLDRRGRNHLSNGLHRKLDLASSTHCRKAKANDGYRYEVAYSVHNIRVFEKALACRCIKPTRPFCSSLSNRRPDLCGTGSPKKPDAKTAKSWRPSVTTENLPKIENVTYRFLMLSRQAGSDIWL
jgi:hypothetical protein